MLIRENCQSTTIVTASKNQSNTTVVHKSDPLPSSPSNYRESAPIEIEDEELPLKIESLVLVEKPTVTFDTIGGLKEVKEILKMEAIYPRLYPEKYRLYGRTPGNGILLWGAPGCGKTMLAKAIARESNESVFISPKVSDIMNRWVGQSEKVIAAIFEFARKFNNATLFFDEIDYIAPRAGPSYMMRIKRELLQQMDGISSKKDGLLVLGATNRPWVLDPAARRPSPDGVRFSKTIFVPPPDFEARKEIYQKSLAKLKTDMIADNVDAIQLARLSEGYSGADIGAIVEEAVDRPLNSYIKGEPPRPVNIEDFRIVISEKPKSIIPWIVDAEKAVHKRGEKEMKSQISALAEEYFQN